MRINLITLFPQLIQEHLNYLPFKKAIEKGFIDVNIINLRDYALDTYGTVDGKPYGGGTGMLLRIEPIYNALNDLKMINTKRNSSNKIILTTPTGKIFDQKKAEEMSKYEELTIICGRYEGVDARISNYVDEEVSIGNFVLTGGELAALVMLESSVRLIPGVLEKEEAVQLESFSQDLSENLEYPQYTRPDDFMGYKVPQELLSGNHKEIEKWKKNNLRKRL
jgi:tRNA (guanine37-N1)-methyltransferase